MAAPKDFITGFNHNVRHKGEGYHVQTEDSGEAIAHVLTHLFQGGNILASKKTSYAELRGTPDIKILVRALMEEQHRQMLRQLVNGAFDSATESARAVRSADANAGGSVDANAAPKAPNAPSSLVEVIRFASPNSRDLDGRAAPGAAVEPPTTGFLPPIQRSDRGSPGDPASDGSPPKTARSAAVAKSSSTASEPSRAARATPPVSGPGDPLQAAHAPEVHPQAASPSKASIKRSIQSMLPFEDLRSPGGGSWTPQPPQETVGASRPERAAPAWPTAVEAAYFSERVGGAASSSSAGAPPPSGTRPGALLPAAPTSSGSYLSSERTPGPPEWRQDAPGETIFGEELISEKSLDQVILRYLAGDRDE